MLDRFDAAGELAGTVQTIYAAAVEGGGLAAALDCVRAAVGADAAALWREGRPGRSLLASAAAPEETAALLAAALAAAPDPAPWGTPAGPLAGAPVATVAAAAGGLRLQLARGSGAAAFAPETLALAADLAGHLRMAGAVAGRIGAANVERQVYTSLLDKLAVGAIFLDARGQTVQLTGLARDILAAQDGLRPCRGGIAATADHDDRRLQAAIRGVLAGSADQPQVVPVGRASGQRSLGLVIHRIAGRQPAAEASRGAACVILVRDPEHAAEPERTMLRRLFDLTAAEAEVARQLAIGLSLDEVAEALGISRNTARAHLRAIFAKSGISRQTELIRLVLRSAAMLGEEPLPLAS